MTDIGVAFTESIRDLIGLNDTSVPAVYRARQFIADSVSSLPLQQMMGKIKTDEVPDLLVDPSGGEETYHETMNQIVLSLVDYGNTYWWVKNFDRTGMPKAIFVVDPREVSVQWDRRRLYRVYDWRGQKMDPGRNFIHLSMNRGPGELKGKGVIEAARETTLRTAQAEESLSLSLVEDNYNPSLVLKAPEVKTKADAERVLSIWMASRDNSDKGRQRPAVMNSNSELETHQFSPNDSQWIESRNFTIQNIGRLFGIHGIFLLVSSADALTYATTESIFRLFLTTTLRPTYLERVEAGFSRLLGSSPNRMARFDVSEILRADIASRYQAHQIGLGGGKGFKTVNEVREDEGLPPIEGGDELIAISTQPAEVPEIEGEKVDA